jgi:CBS domain-containing protein
MFSVYSMGGRMFSGTLEQLRQVGAVSPASRPRAAQAVGRDPSDSAYGTLADDAHRAYTQTQEGPSPRHPIKLVHELMSRPVFTLPHSAAVMQAWRLLAKQGVGQAPVVNEAGVLVGLLQRADVLPSPNDDAHAWGALLLKPVTEVMHTPIPGVALDTDVRRVAQVLLDLALPGLPVIGDEGEVIGFISRSDILRAVVNDPPLDLWS